jgi:NDP-sugar pyrophosphorylase family protein
MAKKYLNESIKFGNRDLIVETGVFSIIDLYMRLAESGERIAAHRVDEAMWIDIGEPEQLERARQLSDSN